MVAPGGAARPQMTRGSSVNMVDTRQPVCEAHVMKRTPQSRPDRRPRTISVTLEHFDQWFNYADEARRLFDAAPVKHLIAPHIQASDLLSYARRQPDCRVLTHPDGTAPITVTRRPRISTKQKI